MQLQSARGTATTLSSGILTSGGLLIWMHRSSVDPAWFIVAAALLVGVAASAVVAFNIWTWERIQAAGHLRDSRALVRGGVRTIAIGLALGYASWFALRDMPSLSTAAILPPSAVFRFVVASVAVLPITSWLAFLTHIQLATGRR